MIAYPPIIGFVIIQALWAYLIYRYVNDLKTHKKQMKESPVPEYAPEIILIRDHFFIQFHE